MLKTLVPDEPGCGLGARACALLLSLATMSAAAQTVRIEPNDESGEVVWANGVPYVASDVIDTDGSGTRVIVSPAEQSYGRNDNLTLLVAVYNSTDHDIVVSSADVSATNSEREPLEVVSAADKRAERGREIAMAIAIAGSAPMTASTSKRRLLAPASSSKACWKSIHRTDGRETTASI